MSKDYWARHYVTGDLSGTDQRAVLKYTEAKIIKASVIQLNMINDPVFTGLKMKIYSTRDKRPASLIATSTTTWNTAQVKAHFDDPALGYGRKQIYFEYPLPILLPDTWYAYVLQADTYTGSLSSHISWGLDYVNGMTTEEVAAAGNLAKMGMMIGNIGAPA